MVFIFKEPETAEKNVFYKEEEGPEGVTVKTRTVTTSYITRQSPEEDDLMTKPVITELIEPMEVAEHLNEASPGWLSNY